MPLPPVLLWASIDGPSEAEPKGLRNLWVEPAEPVRPGGGISNKNEHRQARTEYAKQWPARQSRTVSSTPFT